MKIPNTSIKFAFFGTPDIAITTLNTLEANGLVPAIVVTRPDKPAGRGNVLTASPVKEWALKRGIDVLQPVKITPEFIADIGNTEWDAFVVVAYGAILPKALIDLPRRGTLNMHPSLLPKLRGPSPIQSAILTNEQATGVSVMLIDEKMDHGPVIAQTKVEIEDADWPMRASLLEDILGAEGAVLLTEVLPKWVNEEIEASTQDDTLATLCKKVTKEDGLISLTDDAQENLRKICAFEGWPGTYTFFRRNGTKIRVAIIAAHIESNELIIDRVKPEGKNEMVYADFLRGGAKPV